MIRFILIFCVILCFAPVGWAQANCPQNFAAMEPRYVFSDDDLKRIKSYCNNGHLSELRPSGTTVPAELMLYASYVCDSVPNSRINSTLSRAAGSLSTEGPVSPLATAVWQPLKAAKPSFEGVPAKLKSQWKKQALKNLEEEKEILLTGNNAYTSNPTFLLRLKQAMPFLTEEEIKQAIRELASSRASFFVQTYPGVPSPNAFQFMKESIRRDLGLPYRPLTDFVMARPAGDTAWLMLLSVDIPANAPSNTVWMNGVGITSVRNLRVPLQGAENDLITEGVATWTIGPRNYEAAYSLKLGKRMDELAPAMNSLDHEALRADGKLTGMIFPGVNMGLGEAGGADVMNEYQKYYRNKGYKFSKAVPVESFEQFMADEIKSGRLDYLVKEEHALGGSSFGQIAARGTLKTGKKRAADGKEEVIHIFYPEKKALAEEKGKSLNFEEVAGWMKARTDGGGSQLFYVDTSCGGIGPACKLSMLAGDKNLVVAGSTESMDTFTNSPASPVYHLLEGVREKKHFPAIEAAMVQNNTANESTYLLPHSEQWRKQVLEANPVAVNAQIRVTENGNPVDLETVGR